MKLSYLTAFFLIWISTMADGQNLVPNWSFEDYDLCPDDYGQVERAIGWHRSLNNNVAQYSTEYMNACTSFNFGAPSNVWGTQVPSTGSAYMGQVSMAPSVMTDYRENIYIQLIAPLEPNYDYTVHFKVSWADGCKHASNHQGVKFSTVPDFPINGISQVYSVAIIADKLNWTEVSGSFTADSAYSYVCVGNFFTDAATMTSTPCPSCPNYHYGYYIDDVCVFPKHSGSGDCAVAYVPAAIHESHGALDGMQVFQSVAGVNVHFSLPLPRNAALTLYDVQGRSLATIGLEKGTATGDLPMHGIAPGIYILDVSTGGERWCQRFLKLQ